MKATLFVKVNFLIWACLLASFLFFFSAAFAAGDSTGASSDQLLQINKKLDESQKREERILANQEKIIAEIIKSRKWAYNN